MSKKKRGGDSNLKFQRRLDKKPRIQKTPQSQAGFFARRHEEYNARTISSKTTAPNSLMLNVMTLLQSHPQLAIMMMQAAINYSVTASSTEPENCSSSPVSLGL